MTHSFKSNGIEYLGVLLPEDITNPKIVNYPRSGAYLMQGEFNGLNAPKIKLPKGNYEFICSTLDITEEQAKGIVGDYKFYKYRTLPEQVVIGAINCFQSLMLKEEMYSVNQYEKIPDWEYGIDQWENAKRRTGVWVILKSTTPAGV